MKKITLIPLIFLINYLYLYLFFTFILSLLPLADFSSTFWSNIKNIFLVFFQEVSNFFNHDFNYYGIIFGIILIIFTLFTITLYLHKKEIFLDLYKNLTLLSGLIILVAVIEYVLT